MMFRRWASVASWGKKTGGFMCLGLAKQDAFGVTARVAPLGLFAGWGALFSALSFDQCGLGQRQVPLVAGGEFGICLPRPFAGAARRHVRVYQQLALVGPDFPMRGPIDEERLPDRQQRHGARLVHGPPL